MGQQAANGTRAEYPVGSHIKHVLYSGVVAKLTAFGLGARR